MREQLTKSQHYVPQFYLKNFLDDSGTLYGFDKVKLHYFPCHTKDICKEDWLYEICLPGTTPKERRFILPNSIENSFVDKEGEFSSLFSQLIERCSNPANIRALILSSTEKELLHKFVLNLIFRHPWALKQTCDDRLIRCLMKDERLKPIETLLREINFEDRYESLVKMASHQVWLADDLAGGIQEKMILQLKSMHFTILKSGKTPFVTSAFPILYDVFDRSENEALFKTIFFSVNPQFAVIYSRGNRTRDYRNRICDISERQDTVFKLNNWYLGQNIERSRLIFAKKKSTLISLVNHG